MIPTSVPRLATLLAVLGLGGCGVKIENDGHMFQRWADRVTAIPVEDPGAKAAAPAAGPKSDPSSSEPSPQLASNQASQPMASAERTGLREAMAINVVDPDDMPGAAAIRKAVQAVKTSVSVGSVQAGLRSAISGPALEIPAAVDERPGGTTVQLAAFPDEAAARAAWARLRAAHPQALASLSPRFERADLGARGVWVRLKAGPVATPEDAKRICAAVGALERWCAGPDTPRA